MFSSIRKPAHRLKGYDYHQDGLYYITICTANFVSYFGEVREGKMEINAFGKIIQGEWLRTPYMRSYVRLHEFKVMPNHFHAIIEIHELPLPSTENFSPVKIVPFYKNKFGGRISGDLFAIIRGFKGSARAIINSVQKRFVFEWQESFQDRIIRDNKEFNRLVAHIKNNPRNWAIDPNNPQSPKFTGIPSIY